MKNSLEVLPPWDAIWKPYRPLTCNPVAYCVGALLVVLVEDIILNPLSVIAQLAKSFPSDPLFQAINAVLFICPPLKGR